MTLRNLRELRLFLERLCKFGLLKYPENEFNDAMQRSNRRIKWTQINQHDIVATVVKRIIPEKDSCSWVEMIANGRPQTRRFFCSHNWSEPFRDFMKSIEFHTRYNSIGAADSYWICVYANDQWNVQLGVKLIDSPFYEALRSSETTLLMLDKSAEALERIWVAFEMTETYRLGQPLQAWTAVGQVGSVHVASGPFLEAMTNVRIENAQASNPCDQRQILNHIVGIDELTGLVVGHGGKELDPSHPIWVYEDNLLDAYAEQFHNWDKELSQLVVNNFDKSTAHKQHISNRLPDSVSRGITLAQLRAVQQEFECCLEKRVAQLAMRNTTKRSGSLLRPEDATMFDLRRMYVRPRTKDLQCSFVELVADGEQRPEFHVTCTWSTTFKDFMAAIEWHAEAREVPDSTSYWIDLFAENQCDEEDNFVVAGPGSLVYDSSVARVIQDVVIGIVLVLDEKGTTLQLGSNLYEMHLAIESSQSVDLLGSKGAIATTRPFPDGRWLHGDIDHRLADSAMNVDVEHANFQNDVERNIVLNSIASDSRDPDPNRVPKKGCWEYVLFDQRLRHHFAGPVLREAAYNNDLAAIRRVSRQCPLIDLDSPQMQGDLGEKAIHCAAAAGHAAAVEQLLSMKSNPNAQDREGETPLHYAAFCGHLAVVSMLLTHDANPARESYSAEWPYEVADQNPAYFLGVDTSEVHMALQDAMARRAQKHKAFLGVIPASSKETTSDGTAKQLLDRFDQCGIHTLHQADLEKLLTALGCRQAAQIASCLEIPGAFDGAIDTRTFLRWVFELDD
eukprot:TRINITY_DN23461_c0_g1_i2.p1 TRINITY_DN23461_c0_g1~~TRINITY_DN23461_c0_g1_i2.p1  ORF type:complete len:834 (-),score=82.75 TRINITY_DN23461_c0_g1_i2:157-2523(-)